MVAVLGSAMTPIIEHRTALGNVPRNTPVETRGLTAQDAAAGRVGAAFWVSANRLGQT
jgi:hypothetical protein